MQGSICSYLPTPQTPRSHYFSTWQVWFAPKIMGTLGLIVEIPHSDTYHHSVSAQKGNFLGPAAKEGIAILFTDTSPRGAGIEGEDDHYDFGTGAGFYLDATNPKYALHYNMRTHIQFEIPQVLETSGLPIVNSGIYFSPFQLNRQCRILHVYLYLAIAWVAMGH